jgi:hypothetical protein
VNGLCLGLAFSLIQATVPAQRVTLAWVHSIEKIRWEEDYRVDKDKLTLVRARIRGSGAGMEPPAGAVLRNGAWEYQPAQAVFPKLILARSSYTKDYELCWDGQCKEFTTLLGAAASAETIEVFPCPSR